MVRLVNQFGIIQNQNQKPAYATAYQARAQADAICVALDDLKTLSNQHTRVKLSTDSRSNIRARASTSNRPSWTIESQSNH